MRLYRLYSLESHSRYRGWPGNEALQTIYTIPGTGGGLGMRLYRLYIPFQGIGVAWE